jgi:gamma-glutamylcyclotransferase (GGCT)/AIG2-like uncharacterized protein YtfP
MNESALLFVYGSLRPGAGHAMGRWLAEQGKHAGAAWMPQAALYRVDWYPGMTGGTGRVRGDLFMLRDPVAAWPALDAFEGIRRQADDEYERRLCSVEREDGERVTVWAYWYRLPVQGLTEVGSGDWLAR